MPEPHSNALVLLGATGDLSYKEIFVPEFTSHDEPVLTHDSSTNALIRRYRRIKAGRDDGR